MFHDTSRDWEVLGLPKSLCKFPTFTTDVLAEVAIVTVEWSIYSSQLIFSYHLRLFNCAKFKHSLFCRSANVNFHIFFMTRKIRWKVCEWNLCRIDNGKKWKWEFSLQKGEFHSMFQFWSPEWFFGHFLLLPDTFFLINIINAISEGLQFQFEFFFSPIFLFMIIKNAFVLPFFIQNSAWGNDFYIPSSSSW